MAAEGPAVSLLLMGYGSSYYLIMVIITLANPQCFGDKGLGGTQWELSSTEGISEGAGLCKRDE